MASLTRSVAVYSDGSIKVQGVEAPKKYVGYRVRHRLEGGFPSPTAMPNVRRAKDAPPVEFTPALQALSFNFMTWMNRTISRNEWVNVFSSKTAFTNRNGVETDHPKLMDGIICAGMFIRSEIMTDKGVEYLECRPGIHAIDVNKPLPSMQTILDNNWYFVANTGQGPEGARHFPQGDGLPVCVIYALDKPVRYLTQGVEEGTRYTNFEKWESDVLPDPLKYYL